MTPLVTGSPLLEAGRVFLPTISPSAMMSWTTIFWSMAAAASLTLGLVHLIVWWQNRERSELLWFFLMTAATARMTFTELAMMKATTAAEYGSALR